MKRKARHKPIRIPQGRGQKKVKALPTGGVYDSVLVGYYHSDVSRCWYIF